MLPDRLETLKVAAADTLGTRVLDSRRLVQIHNLGCQIAYHGGGRSSRDVARWRFLGADG